MCRYGTQKITYATEGATVGKLFLNIHIQHNA